MSNKSKLKVYIIQAIDRKVALDDIAVSKGLEFGELLDEVEAIVYSGTKLNIDYFLEEIMDEDHLNDIYDYFKESTTDKIDDAMDELGDDYTEDEIRLVRIKFISEMANWCFFDSIIFSHDDAGNTDDNKSAFSASSVFIRLSVAISW